MKDLLTKFPTISTFKLNFKKAFQSTVWIDLKNRHTLCDYYYRIVNFSKFKCLQKFYEGLNNPDLEIVWISRDKEADHLIEYYEKALPAVNYIPFGDKHIPLVFFSFCFLCLRFDMWTYHYILNLKATLLTLLLWLAISWCRRTVGNLKLADQTFFVVASRKRKFLAFILILFRVRFRQFL